MCLLEGGDDGSEGVGFMIHSAEGWVLETEAGAKSGCLQRPNLQYEKNQKGHTHQTHASHKDRVENVLATAHPAIPNASRLRLRSAGWIVGKISIEERLEGHGSEELVAGCDEKLIINNVGSCLRVWRRSRHVSRFGR